MASNDARIAWISDIHLRSAYAKGKAKDRVCKIFKDFIEKIAISNHNLDYLIISGDIGFAGNSDEYKLFDKYFLEPLHHAFTLTGRVPRIITIPGNHDISWSADLAFKKYLATYTSKSAGFRERSAFIGEHKPEFEKCFGAYTKFFSRTDSEMTRQFFDFESKRIFVDPNYQSKKLYGYVVDYYKEIIFVMLNSAWYSIGDNFNKLLVSENPNSIVSDIKKLGNDLETKDIIDAAVVKLLDLKSKIVEFGSQIANADMFPLEELWKKILENPKFTVVTIMHHPPAWLSWSEMYSYKDSKKEPALVKILRNSDLLLTGHEHVPVTKNQEYDGAGFFHLKGGMFMEDDIRKEDYFLHSRFSRLIIHNFRDGCSYEEEKFLYDKDQPVDPWTKPYDSGKQIINTREHRISEQREKRIIEKFSEFDIPAFLEKKLGRKEVPETIDLGVFVRPFGDFRVATYRWKEDVRVVILVKEGLTFFQPEAALDPEPTEEKVRILYECVHKIIEAVSKIENPPISIKIHFILLDLLVIKSLTEFQYPIIELADIVGPPRSEIRLSNNGTKSSEEVYSDIVRFSEQVFNNFRNSFFTIYETEALDLVAKGNPSIDIQAFMNHFNPVSRIKFILDILSFWDFEKYIPR